MGHSHKHKHGWTSFKARTPAPTSADWEKANLTTDGTWQELDISAIVPEDTKLIAVWTEVKDDTVNKVLRLAGEAGNAYCFIVATQVANQSNYEQGIVPTYLNSSGKQCIKYVTSNAVFTLVNITIFGWWLS